MNRREVYERLIDLAIKVAEGKVNPLEVDVASFIEQIKWGVIPDYADLRGLLDDVRALNGLTVILEAQSKLLKEKGLGLYFSRFLIKLRLMKMDVNDLVEVFKKSWSPSVGIEVVNLDALKRSLVYFVNLPTPLRRRLRQEGGGGKLSCTEVEKPFKLVNVEKQMEELYQKLVEYSNYRYVEYYDFLRHTGDPIESAYLLSYLLSEGYVEAVVDRFLNKVYIRPRASRTPIKSPTTLVTTLKLDQHRNERG